MLKWVSLIVIILGKDCNGAFGCQSQDPEMSSTRLRDDFVLEVNYCGVGVGCTTDFSMKGKETLVIRPKASRSLTS